MSRTVVDSPELRRWLGDTSRSSARQYAIVLRPLLALHDALTVNSSDLVDYVLQQSKASNRRKTVTATKAFFGDLFEIGRRSDDPSHRLDMKVREAVIRSERRLALITAGIGDTEAEQLCWSSVLSSMIAEATADLPLFTIAPLLDDVEAEMLDRLGGMSAQQFRALMRERVV